MNKVTKLGVSALCGSLAAVSAANAGDLTVTGGADMSWVSLDDTTTGNNIGMGSNLTFSGSGELDNGWTVALSVAMNNQDNYSNTNVVVTIPSLGDFRIDQGTSATGIDRMDDVTPTVWEEAYAAGVGAGINTINGSAGGSTIEYTPNLTPDGLTARIAYSPDVSGKNAADKGTAAGTAANPEGSGFDITLEATDALHGLAGLTLYGGYSEISQDSSVANYSGDQEEQTFAIKYAAGGFTIGYQWSEEDLGTSANEKQYENEGYGITFNVNDDLSIGYVNYESTQTSATDTVAEATSIQIAYSAGGASIRLAETDVDNNAYQTAALTSGAPNDRGGTTLSVALAF
jgi:outer membrane protein OmpU